MECSYCTVFFVDDTVDLLKARATPLQLHRKARLRQKVACAIRSGEMIRKGLSIVDVLSDAVGDITIDVNGRRMEENIFDCPPDHVGCYIFERLPSITRQLKLQHKSRCCHV